MGRDSSGQDAAEDQAESTINQCLFTGRAHTLTHSRSQGRAPEQYPAPRTVGKHFGGSPSSGKRGIAICARAGRSLGCYLFFVVPESALVMLLLIIYPSLFLVFLFSLSLSLQVAVYLVMKQTCHVRSERSSAPRESVYRRRRSATIRRTAIRARTS